MTAKIFCLVVLVIAICALATSATAKIWRVDNNPGNAADWRTIQAAHDGSASGDTLYVSGTAISYGNLFASKKLFVFGPGYLLGENPKTQANLASAKTDAIRFDSGSDSSLVTGLDVQGTLEVNIGVSSVTIKRNRIVHSFSPCVWIDDNTTNIFVIQNYIQMTSNSSGTDAIRVDPGVSSTFINNNFIEAGVTTTDAIDASTTSSITVEQNVIRGDVIVYNTGFNNNVWREGTFTGTNNAVFNNITNSTQFASFDTTNANQSSVDMATVFVGTGSTDGQWQLTTGSPAIGAGLGGNDIGMFGGLDPYILSGMPAIPAIYFFSAPVSGSNTSGLPVQVKVKSHN